jgi:PAS domain S-box-containing protein
VRCRQAKEELALKVSERTAELRAVNERLQVELAERRRAEAALKASEQRFRALIENSADAITLFDATGKVVYDSPAAPGMLGYAPDELVGQSFLEYVHPDDAPLVGSLFGQLLQAPRARSRGEFHFRHKDGAWRWLEGVATNLQDDPPQVVTMFVRVVAEA